MIKFSGETGCHYWVKIWKNWISFVLRVATTWNKMSLHPTGKAIFRMVGGGWNDRCCCRVIIRKKKYIPNYITLSSFCFWNYWWSRSELLVLCKVWSFLASACKYWKRFGQGSDISQWCDTLWFILTRLLQMEVLSAQ